MPKRDGLFTSEVRSAVGSLMLVVDEVWLTYTSLIESYEAVTDDCVAVENALFELETLLVNFDRRIPASRKGPEETNQTPLT